MSRSRPVRVLALFLAFGVSSAIAGASPSSRSTLPSKEVSSTSSEITSINVTAYNSGLSLIHDRRRVTLGAGEHRLAWRDVAATLQSETAKLSEPKDPRDLSLFEENFDYDVLGGAAILAHYVGLDVTVTHPAGEAGRPHRETARVVVGSDGNIVLRYTNRIETGVDGTLSFPRLPGDLRDRPTLVLDIATAASRAHDFDLAYLAEGIAWHADYVGVVSRDASSLELNGVITLSNTSGATYRNARLQLVAGKVNAPPPTLKVYKMMPMLENAAVALRKPVEENFGEYHLYTVRRPTTIEQNQTKQVSLLDARAVPIRETLELRGEAEQYRSSEADLGEPLPVSAYVTFVNHGGDLGVPLPAGNVRLYRAGADGSSQYLSASSIDHTPAGQEVRMLAGTSYDVTARKRRTAFTANGNEEHSSYEIVLSNAKTTPVDVLVVEPIPCDWTITQTSQPFARTSSSTATWTVHVAPGDKTKLTYSLSIHC